MSNFSHNLKQVMLDKNIKLSQLGEETGVSIKTIHGWLVGKNPRSIKDVFKIASYLGVTLDFLFTGRDLPGVSLEKISESKAYDLKSIRILSGRFKVFLDE